jgi:serine/threonine protein kinase
VYLCQDEHGNKLAMKLFQEKLDMEIEIDALSKLKKIDGVVQIVDVIYFNILGVDFGAFTMLYMEYTLKSYVEAFNPKEEMIIEVFYELLCILKDLHANCVIHCDMKQENVLLTEDSRICLADFGISKILPDGIHMIKINDEIVTSWFQCPINSLSKANNEPFIVSWIADLYGLCVSMIFLLSFNPYKKKFDFFSSYLFHIFREKNYFEIDEDEDEDEDHKSKKKIDIKGSTEKIHNACSIVKNKFFRELLMACMDPESILGWYTELETDPSNNNSIIPKIIEKIEDYFGWVDTPPRSHAMECH